MHHSLQLTPVVDVRQYLQGGELVAFNIGPDGAVYLLITLLPIDYRSTGSGATFANTQPQIAQSYRLVALDEGKPFLDTTIRGESYNIHYVQPLPEGLLLVCGRSHFRSAHDFEKNGRIYSFAGEFQREVLLGDGIQDVQTTSRGTVWTSYFDEGVFGNFGWNDPIGASGLVEWDAMGNQLYEFAPTGGLDAICDCYALNVVSENDVWCYYYMEFPLVRISHRKVVAFWQTAIAGSGAFAIADNMALFRGGYKHRGNFYFMELRSDGNARTTASFELCDEDRVPLALDHVRGRADSLFVLSGSSVYRFAVAAAAAVI